MKNNNIQMEKYLVHSNDTDNIYEIVINNESNNVKLRLNIKNCILGDLPKLIPISGISAKLNCFNTFQLENLDYHNDCSYNIYPLPRGDLGTVDMLKTALGFIKSKYDYIKFVKFTDSSKVPCNSISLSLFHLYLALHGKTWYECK